MRETFNKTIGELTAALQVIQKYRGDVTYEISKMEAGTAKDQANRRLNTAIDQNRASLRSMYDASVRLMQRVASGEIGNRPGDPIEGWTQLYHYQPEVGVIYKFQEAVELVYGIDKAPREQAQAAMLKVLAEKGAKADAEMKAQKQRGHRRGQRQEPQLEQPMLALPGPINVNEPD